MTLNEWVELPGKEAAEVYLRGGPGFLWRADQCPACRAELLQGYTAWWLRRLKVEKALLAITCDHCGAVLQVYSGAPGVKKILARGTLRR